MENTIFVDVEIITLVIHHDEDCEGDYVDYNTPNTSRVDETIFSIRSSTDKPSTLQLRQKMEQDKLAAL